MPTAISDLIPMLKREINAPGFEQYPDIGGGDQLGYIEDGFWDVRLAGMLGSYTVEYGQNLPTPLTTGAKYFTDSSTKTEDLEQKYWMMIILFAGLRLLRLKIMNLAVNFKAEAGPVSYEQQASATVLRALLDSLMKRVQELKGQYSDDFNASVFLMWDGIAQDQYATIQGLQEQAIYY